MPYLPMLQNPDLPEEMLSSHLKDEFGIDVQQVMFLPLGYDVHTVVYRVEAVNGCAYFLKLRMGEFEPISVTLPHQLHLLGIHAIIPPMETRTGQLFGQLLCYTTILYPYITGKNGYERSLTDRQWLELGQTLRSVHEADLSKEFSKSIPREGYDPQWRLSIIRFLALVENEQVADSVSHHLAAFMRCNRDRIIRMVARADVLADSLKSQFSDFVLCHSDAHPGNYLVAETGELYIVDWDNPVFAPRERDLMCIGSGMSGSQINGREERLFYEGYGAVEINRQALAYYRYERIIQDIAEFCAQILQSNSGGEDRQQSYNYFLSSFSPGHEVEVAFMTDQGAG